MKCEVHSFVLLRFASTLVAPLTCEYDWAFIRGLRPKLKHVILFSFGISSLAASDPKPMNESPGGGDDIQGEYARTRKCDFQFYLRKPYFRIIKLKVLLQTTKNALE